MSERIWHKGPPPHMGWWLTILEGDDEPCWRWFTGTGWTYGAHESSSADCAERIANIGAVWATGMMEWCDYWPENARVPRFNPNGANNDNE